MDPSGLAVVFAEDVSDVQSQDITTGERCDASLSDFVAMS